MTCPKCGSDNVMPTYIKGKYKCLECGAVFTAPGQQSSSNVKETAVSNAFKLKGE
jgi:transcription initiation factor TFIIIB Brf1 subunit/transcription initiation factor TFIIB